MRGAGIQSMEVKADFHPCLREGMLCAGLTNQIAQGKILKSLMPFFLKIYALSF